jgi:hypothetical protein
MRAPKKRRRRRRSGGADPQPQNPARLVKTSLEIESAPATTIVDRPLTSAEIAEVKQHFRFLRDHRKNLKLKLNAQEDLLLNGAREPTSRGICHHLLSKVDYSRVVAVTARLAPTDRPSFVAGVLRFKNELPLLLLYLESLKDSGHKGAVAALESALDALDFGSVSEGQMRRVLELVVESFDSAGRATLLFGLLQSSTFRNAFDDSLSKLPDALSELLAPLRAVHAAVIMNSPSPAGSTELARGLCLLLDAGLPGFERRSVSNRLRFLELALTEHPGSFSEHTRGIERLLDGLDPAAPRTEALEQTYLSGLLHRGNDQRAAARLKRRLERVPADGVARALLQAVEAPRVGRVALLAPKRQSPAPAELLPGYCLVTQRPVWVRLGTTDDRHDMVELSALLRSLVVPGVVRARPPAPDSPPFTIAPRAGTLLRAQSLKHPNPGAAISQQLLELIACLASTGIRLPDADLMRFELEGRDRLRLLNAWGAERVAPQTATTAMLELCRKNLVQNDWLTDDERERLRSAPDFPELVSVLAEKVDALPVAGDAAFAPAAPGGKRRRRGRSAESKAGDPLC